MQGVLYLLPNTLGNPDTSHTIPAVVSDIAKSTGIFIVENLRNARRYLKNLDTAIDIDRLTFHELNEHTSPDEVPGFLCEVLTGSNAAVITEAGVPGVADPGALVVRIAHEKGIRVIPLTGPSSVLLALMASGLNGQAFCFHGYLPVKRPERILKIREVEKSVKQKGETQIFIEAPYRNDAMLSDILETCDPSSLLCVAVDITLDSEYILTQAISLWKRKKPILHKRPVIFLLGS
ncbi:MAG: SAM-dependent methyltransferase [Bacteroidota bacterium]